MSWIYHKPVFSYNASELKSAWIGHRYFAYDLVRNLQPDKIVELGTYYGLSFFSFCEAVKDGKLNTRCYAIDTWQGDGNSGLYADHVYTNVKNITDTFYSDSATLLRGTFDDALDHFEDGSISLLHIDGFHSYEASSHDYRSWLPKLADNGIVLMHDIHAYYEGFGVYRLWEELKEHPRFEFTHSHGLGVLFPKGCTKFQQSLITLANEFKKHYE
ncbi:class I SAM-dependent methyltransferase [Paenibacillaceae bacterium]|nr:class I SAM-dependent methyltransferase [Paenibacillaceae bacterium]